MRVSLQAEEGHDWAGFGRFSASIPPLYPIHPPVIPSDKKATEQRSAVANLRQLSNKLNTKPASRPLAQRCFFK